MNRRHAVLRRFGVLVTTAVLAAGLLARPAAANADPTPAAPPPAASVTAAACESIPADVVGAFVSTWSANLDDDAFMKNYLAGGGAIPLPGATDSERACVVDQLAAGLTASHPGFGVGRDPKLVRALLASLIFKRGKNTETSGAATIDPTAATSTGLNDVLAALRKLLPVPVPIVTPTLQVGAVTSIGADAVLDSGPSAPPLLSLHTGLTYTASNQPLPGPLASLPTPADLLGLLGTILNGLTYRVCAESATMTNRCSLPVPLGVPVLADDTGEGLPDVIAQLLPVLTFGAGIQLQFNVATLPILGTTAPAHVYAVFSIVGTNRQFAVGFDGRPSRLGTWNSMAFTLKSIIRAIQGDIDTQFALGYTNPGAVSAVTFGVATMNQATTLTDPIDASLKFDPTPTSFTTDLRIQNTATPEYTVGVQSTVPTTLTAHAAIVQTAAHTETAIDGVIDKLPTSVSVDVNNAGSSLTADYHGSAQIADLKLAARTLPDVADPSTYTVMSTELTQIPTDMHLVVTKPYDAVLTTNTPIGPSSVSLRSAASGVVHQEIFGQVDTVPTSLHLHGDVTGAGDDFTAAFTYAADASIPNVHFRLYDDQDLHAFVDATAADLPKYMQVSVAKHPHDSVASFDARTAATDPAGSSSVGPITLKYTSTGTQLADADLPSTDYVVMNETATDVQAALRYTGLSLVRYQLHDDITPAGHDTISAELKNAAARVVTLQGDTPALQVNSVVDAVPADMTLDYARTGTATDVHYHASSAISSITAAVSQKTGNHASVGASIAGVPDDVALHMDQAAGAVQWNASGHVGSVGLSGQVDFGGRTWFGGATLTDVPPSWTLGFGPSTYSFLAGSALDPTSVGSLEATLTNHGTAQTQAGNHAFANFDQGSGALDASFRMSSIHAFSYTPTAGGFVANSQMGGGQPFRVKANLLLADGNATAAHLDTITADATISPLPTSMTLSQDGTALDYTSDTSPTIDASIGIGRADALAAAPAPPVVRGASLRDGGACDPACATAYRAHLFLEGAPSGLHADLSKIDFGITHYAPPASDPTFNADVALSTDPDPAKHFSAQLTLGGIATSGQDMEIGPITTTAGPVPNSETTSVSYHGNHAVGPLTATAVFGDKTAMVTVSNLPTTMAFSATTRPDGIEFTGDLADPITKIEAFYKPTGAASWALTGALTDIPRHFDFSQLTIGDQPASDPCAPPPPKPPVPTVNFTATNGPDSPDTLDITASVDLHQLSAGLSGQVTAGITNLGHDTHASWDGTHLNLTSTPKTDAFEVHVPNAVVAINAAFDTSAPDPCHPSSGHSFISFNASGHLNVTVQIGDAALVLTDVSSLTLTPGFSTGVQGNFGNLSFGWNNLHVDVDAAVKVDVTIDFGGGITVSPTLASLAAVVSTVVHVDFAVYQQTANPFLNIFPGIPVPCGLPKIYEVQVSITPDRVATGHDGFSVNGPTSANGNAWVISLNPFGIIPDVVLDAVTGLFTSPFPHGLDAGFACVSL